MKFYIATKWENRDQAREFKDKLEAKGHRSTYNWMDIEQESSEQAKADMDAVNEADAIIILAEQEAEYRGAYCEFGAALALNKIVFLIGKGMDRCIFSKHPSVWRVPSYQSFLDQGII